MAILDVWKRDKGWTVSSLTVSRDHIGKLDSGDKINFSGDASGLTIEQTDSDSYWKAEPCQLSSDQRTVSGTLGETAQSFSISLLGSAPPYTLAATVGAGSAKVNGREDEDTTPAGGNWTAQEGS